MTLCGNGVLDSGESCDDGNHDNTDDCLDNCVEARCGDGFVWADHEECDDGNGINTDACLDTCVAARCGDGFRWTGHEECDDGDTYNTDACLDTCVEASCGDGYLWSGHEECDDGNGFNTDGCLSTCVAAVCGDGHRWVGVEECDDGNDGDDHDECLDGCIAATCGDSHVWTGVEECDDGNDGDDHDECLDGCIAATCGDGVVWSGHEPCDGSPATCTEAGYDMPGVGECTVHCEIQSPGLCCVTPAWITAEVDSDPYYHGGATALALDAAGRPHLVYRFDYDSIGYAYHDGMGWQKQWLPISESSSDEKWGLSIALDDADRPHVAYCDSGWHDFTDLWYVYHDGSTWIDEEVDTDLGDSHSVFPSLALDGAGRPHISYHQEVDSDYILKYAYFDGTSWQYELVDTTGNVGHHSSLALDSGERPHIAYYDRGNLDLKYAYHDGTGWNRETVDSAGAVGRYPSLALDSADRPHVAYFDRTNRELRYARRDGTSWVLQTVDSTGLVGEFLSLALDSAGRPHVAYDGPHYDLKYAFSDDTRWHIETVDSPGYPGVYSSLALDENGHPHIGYQHGSSVRYTNLSCCGNGVVDPGEPCDDGNDGDDTNACLDGCVAASCGDGHLWAGHEDCDDGNGINTDACLDTCVAASCGDGYVWDQHEECDDGAANSDTTPDACRTTCVMAACGDGVRDSSEQCDGGTGVDDCTTIGQGYTTGTLACSGSCHWDTSGCTDLLWIPLTAGSFMMGSSSGPSNEQPAHLVSLPGFELTETEVTVSQYAACVSAAVCSDPDTGGGMGTYCNWGSVGYEDYPVNCVSWDQAQNYCLWAGGRLPSEAEWEYAARSEGHSDAYPWGSDPASCTRAVMDDGSGWGCGTGRSVPACSRPAGNTDQGLCDMAGNVREWVEDDYHSSYAGAPADGTAWVDSPRSSQRVARGGSAIEDADWVRARVRIPEDPTPILYAPLYGFRCARSTP
jgi:cysteine-rich repeat protein